MKFWVTYCKVLGYIWLVVTGLLILGSIVVAWMREGFSGVQNLLGSYNLANYAAMAIILAPGFVLLKLSERLQLKAQSKK